MQDDVKQDQAMGDETPAAAVPAEEKEEGQE